MLRAIIVGWCLLLISFLFQNVNSMELKKRAWSFENNAFIESGDSEISLLDETNATTMEFYLDYRSLKLELKNQFPSLSCISQTISTLVEAYFKLHSKNITTESTSSSLSWSGFDIYYCHLTEGLERRMFRFALHKLVGRPIAPSVCINKTLMMAEYKQECQRKTTCPVHDRAIIEQYGFIDRPDTPSIISALETHGPLGILYRSRSSYTQYLDSFEVLKENNLNVYYRNFFDSNRKRDVIKSLLQKDLSWHAQVLLGYGYKDGKLFWLLQNSYGTELGDQGYSYVGENELNFADYCLWYIRKASIATSSIPVQDENSFFQLTKGALSM